LQPAGYDSAWPHDGDLTALDLITLIAYSLLGSGAQLVLIGIA
jgi:hypothetical protein